MVSEETVYAALDLPVWSDAMLACIYVDSVVKTPHQASKAAPQKLLTQALLLPQAHAAQHRTLACTKAKTKAQEKQVHRKPETGGRREVAPT